MSSPSSSRHQQAPDQLRQTVAHLSLHSLRVELSRRNLNPCGLRSSLEARLLADLNKTLAARLDTPLLSSLRVGSNIRLPKKRSLHVISVPRRFPDESGLFSFVPRGVRREEDGCAEREEKGTGKDESVPNGQVEKKKASQFAGVLKGRSVWIVGEEQMVAFWERHGPCGKANLSRSAPSYNTHYLYDAATIKGRALRQLLTMEDIEGKVNEDHEKRLNVEHLQLTLVEAYYCAFFEKCLIVEDAEGELLTDPQHTWVLFSRIYDRFPMLMVAYCRYRSTGWLPRSGVKYGVDWVLYPASVKSHSHAPYCIILRFGNASKPAQIDRSWTALQNRLRLSKSVAKNLVIANVHAKDDLATTSPQDAFHNIQISEVTIDRWLP